MGCILFYYFTFFTTDQIPFYLVVVVVLFLSWFLIRTPNFQNNHRPVIYTTENVWGFFIFCCCSACGALQPNSARTTQWRTSFPPAVFVPWMMHDGGCVGVRLKWDQTPMSALHISVLFYMYFVSVEDFFSS